MDSLDVTKSTEEARARGNVRDAQKTSGGLPRLSLEQRSLLESRLLQKMPQLQATALFDHALPHPLTCAQASLWLLNRLEEGSPIYNISEAVRLKGPLQIPILAKSLETIVERHDSLRTTFFSREGKPMQIVQGNQPFELPVVDLGALTDTERDEEIRRQISTEAKTPFHLKKDILLRGRIIKLAQDDHVLILTTHHIVSDWWSFMVLHRELEALYAAYCAGEPSPLEKLPIQFSEIAAREEERLREPAIERQLSHWKEKLGGKLPILELPTDKPRPAAQSFRGKCCHLHFPVTLLERLKKLGRQNGATLHMTLLAGFAALLHRYTQQDDIIIGTPISGRNSTQSEKLIGFFVGMLPIRLNLQNDFNFRQLLKHVRDTALTAFDNQEVPMEKVTEALQIPRVGGRHPLFQSVFQFLPAPSPPLNLPNISTQWLDADTDTAKFDLAVMLYENEGELQGEFEFNSDLFESAFIERMVGHFRTLLENVATSPEAEIKSLPLLTEPERQQILVEWNNVEAASPRQSTIHQLFEEQVNKTPDAIALIDDNVALTYRELNSRANQVAHHLRQLGLSTGALAGFCVERSPEMIAGLLGILKAGGAYMTLDPAYPQERLAFMFEDTKAPVFVTTKKFAALAPASAKVVCLDDDASAIAHCPNANPPSDATPDHPAYVIYTSGSTGTPKGVVVPHRGVTRLVNETNYFSFHANEVFLQFAPISFDASTLEIFGPLLNGGKLVLFPPSFESLEQLGEVIQRHQITTLWLTSGLFSQMVEHHINYLKNVRWLFSGGDVLSVPHVLKALRELPDTQLINGYGPTENTTFTTCYAIPKDWDGNRSVPIGQPIRQTQVYILDKWMQPVPVGVPGELFIGGEGLALGYLNAPELTAEKFVDHPFPKKSGAKLYRTGDQVRWRPDGNVEFLGRLDSQVKIRGFRVELGEIENTLAHAPSVKTVAVLAQGGQAENKHLVAYVSPQPGCPIRSAELRQFLELKLPAHMIPSQFVFMEDLPLNANGKVDRRQLAEVSPKCEGSAEFAPPRTETERTLAQVWSDLLGAKNFGIHDNLFEIGGHSLLATRLVSRIGALFKVDFPLRTIFESPTIAAQAVVIDQLRQTAPVEAAPILRRRNNGAAASSLNRTATLHSPQS